MDNDCNYKFLGAPEVEIARIVELIENIAHTLRHFDHITLDETVSILRVAALIENALGTFLGADDNQDETNTRLMLSIIYGLTKLE